VQQNFDFGCLFRRSAFRRRTGCVQAGYAITIASPDGGEIKVDGLSDPRDDKGYAKEDVLSLG
jgi:hypothetical protein